MAVGRQDLAGSYIPADQMFVSLAFSSRSIMMLTNYRPGLASTRWSYYDQMEGSATGTVPR
jgi:hypothetical protein